MVENWKQSPDRTDDEKKVANKFLYENNLDGIWEVYDQCFEIRNRLRDKFFQTFTFGDTTGNRKRSRWHQLTKFLCNINQRGFIGGETGASPYHLIREYQWLLALEEQLEGVRNCR